VKGLVNLKQDRDSVQQLGDTIEVLKTAATIQFRAFQLREKPNGDFLSALHTGLAALKTHGVQHPYLTERPGLPQAVVIVTSDEGFLGELNAVLINAGLDRRASPEDELIVLGERGAKYLEEMNLPFKFFPGFGEDINLEALAAIRTYLLNTYLARLGKLSIVYPRFVSLAVQKTEVLSFLPHALLDQPPARTAVPEEELLVEPSADRILTVSTELWAAFQLLDIFWSSKQSEYAARIMHLEGSTQELSVLNRQLAFQYFKELHTARDRSIRDISASKILLERRQRAA